MQYPRGRSGRSPACPGETRTGAAPFLLGAVAFHRELARATRQVVARRGRAVLILIAGLLGVVAATMLGGWLAAVLLEATGL